MISWESERYDWSRLAAVGGRTADDVPRALEDLRAAVTDEAASEAYWRIDNVVVVQGRVLQSAAPTAACAVTLVASAASVFSRTRLLELLEQLSGADSVEGDPGIRGAIIAEIRRGFAMYAGLIEYGTTLEQELCAELLVECARGEPALKIRVEHYLRRIAEDQRTPSQVRTSVRGSMKRLMADTE
jgi:hypothetical protein